MLSFEKDHSFLQIHESSSKVNILITWAYNWLFSKTNITFSPKTLIFSNYFIIILRVHCVPGTVLNLLPKSTFDLHNNPIKWILSLLFDRWRNLENLGSLPKATQLEIGRANPIWNQNPTLNHSTTPCWPVTRIHVFPCQNVADWSQDVSALTLI